MIGIEERSNPVPRHQFEYQELAAAAYDDLRVSDAKWDAEQQALETLLDQAAPAPSQIVDVPVGTGRFLATYAVRGHRVLGLDVSADMLAQAQAKREALGEADIELAIGDITWLGLPDGDVDVAICVRLLNLVDAPVVERAVEELVRVARTHVIVGIRSYRPHAAPRQFARRLRARLTRQPGKLTIHPERRVRSWFAGAGVTVEREMLVATGPHRSSDYRFFLLRVPDRA